MLLFLVKRFGVMMLTLVLTFVVFYLTNLYPIWKSWRKHKPITG